MGIEERDALRKSTFGFVFQHPLLLNYLSVIENVLLAGGTQEFATELLKNLGIGDKMHRFPYELSGGEKHRACIARALINRPEVIFADEPTASLDHANGESVVQQLRTLGTNSALVMVTHDTSMIRNADRIVHLQDGKLI
jgi:putative ABC transport system ATP-binding protein